VQGNFKGLNMTPGSWKKLFIVSAILLVISLILGIGAWHQLSGIKTQLNILKPEMDSLKEEQARILSSYAEMRGQINIRLGIRQDGQSFITPDEPEISAKVQEITGGYSEPELWFDYGSLYQWVMKSIKYSLDSPTPLLPESISGTVLWGDDFWRLPVETIRDGTGDCEDTSVLLASLLLNYNQRRFPVWILGVRTSGAKPKAHVVVAIPCANNQLAIFDIAGHYYTQFPGFGGFGVQEVPRALDHWLKYLAEELPGAQVYVVFSENFYQEFSSNQEFVDWARRLLS
jgi:hypothetical protein